MNTAILLSTYNGEKFIERQLESIFNQSFQDFCLYVRDDGSSDGTIEILKKYSHKHNNMFIFSDNPHTNRGASSSFMWLLNNVEADYYMFCDQDDLWLENKVELQIEAIQNYKMMDKNVPIVVFHDLILTNSQGSIINKSFWSVHNITIENITFESLFVKNVITGCTTLINQKMKTEILKCNQKNIIMYDHLIALIAYSFGKVITIKNGLILYRDHSNSVTPKLEIRFSFRVKNFLQNINRKEYFLPNIIQLEEFLKKFQNNLTAKQIISLKQTISIKKFAPIMRFIILKLRKKI